MSLENIPFRVKYRPNTLHKEKGKIPLILLPRIKKVVEKGLFTNYIFYGSGGLGKSCLAEILTEGTDCLKLNGSKDRGIDVVREQLAEHCEKYSLFQEKAKKTVIFEEFDGTTAFMREALRGFIEENEHVTFIATVNNLNKIHRTTEDQALLSRFNRINFDPLDETEREQLSKLQTNFLKGVAKKEGFEITDDILTKIVEGAFPNFRDGVQQLQELILIGDYETFQEVIFQRKSEVFSFILNGENNIVENYYYVLGGYRDRTDELLQVLSRPLFSYLMETKPEFISQKGNKLLAISKNYNAEYFNTLDPEIHLISYITEIKKLLNE